MKSNEKFPVKIFSCIFLLSPKQLYQYFPFLRQYKNEKDNPFIDQIRKTIEILYKKHIISDDIGISTIHMLQTIENKIKSLFNIIEYMDSSHLIQAEKVFLSEK